MKTYEKITSANPKERNTDTEVMEGVIREVFPEKTFPTNTMRYFTIVPLTRFEPVKFSAHNGISCFVGKLKPGTKVEVNYRVEPCKDKSLKALFVKEI